MLGSQDTRKRSENLFLFYKNLSDESVQCAVAKGKILIFDKCSKKKTEK
jgi:hypothetical protein